MAERGRHLILDCDPGCDDALAMAMVLGSTLYTRIDILTVAGNVCVEQTMANARRVLCAWRSLVEGGKEPFSKEVRIYRGCARSLAGESPSAASVHGRDGLGDIPNRLLGVQNQDVDKLAPVEEQTAVERLVRLPAEARDAREGARRIDLLCTGPLTNIATALALIPDHRAFWGTFGAVVIMGGNFDVPGNITPSAEFNFFRDPLAVEVVLRSWKDTWERTKKDNERLKRAGEKKVRPPPALHIVPLDATERVRLELAKVKRLIENCGRVPERVPGGPTFCEFLHYALQVYGLFHAFSCPRDRTHDGARLPQKYVEAQFLGSTGQSVLRLYCYLHDPLAAWVLLGHLDAKRRIWKDREIRVDAEPGTNRGRVINTKSKGAGLGANPSVELGTNVQALLRMGGDDRKTFRKAVYSLWESKGRRIGS